LLIALAIGMGIEVHPVFFLLGLIIAIAAFTEAIVNAGLTHRHS
jgi:hypothetical protein